MAGAACRPCDVLYDATCAFSGARDFYRQQGAQFVLEKVPDYGNLFSELQHHPATAVRLKPGDRVPPWVDRTFRRGCMTVGQRAALSSPANVGGPHAFKFHSPPLPLHGVDAAAARLATQLAAVRFAHGPAPAAAAPAARLAPAEPAAREAATQSDYRETEAQTLPWSPPYGGSSATGPAASGGSRAPEVLALANLRWGEGLPGGLAEVQRVEALRRKRAFEATLPPIDDLRRLPLRQAMVERWDLEEWRRRADEIRGVQEQRLALLEVALEAREVGVEARHQQQVATRVAARRAEQAFKLAAIHSARMRTVRQLAAGREAAAAAATVRARSLPLTGGAPWRGAFDVVARYADYGSTLYAPLQREGFPDNPANTTGELGSLDGGETLAPLQRLQWLDGLEASLSRSSVKQGSGRGGSSGGRPYRTASSNQATYQERQDAARHADVLRLATLLAQDKAVTVKSSSGTGLAGGDGGAPASVGNEAARGASGGASGAWEDAGGGDLLVGGACDSDPEGAAAAAAALVLLQRLLRGRAAQAEMFAGLAARAALVQELRLGLEGRAGSAAPPEEVAQAAFLADARLGREVCETCCSIAGGQDGSVLDFVADGLAGGAAAGTHAVVAADPLAMLLVPAADGEGVGGSGWPSLAQSPEPGDDGAAAAAAADDGGATTEAAALVAASSSSDAAPAGLGAEELQQHPSDASCADESESCGVPQPEPEWSSGGE